MSYKPVVTGNQTNGNTGNKESIDAGQARKKTVPSHEYILLPLWTPDLPISSSLKSSDDKVDDDVEKKTTKDPAKEDDKDDQDLREFERLIIQGKEAKININNTNSVSAISSPVNTAGTKDTDVNSTNSIYTASPLVNFDRLSYFYANPPDDPKMPNLEDTGIFGGAYDDEDFVAVGDMSNLESFMDMKSAFLYGKIEEEVYICQPPEFEDPEFPNKVYKVEKALYGLHQAPRAWSYTLSFEKLMHNDVPNDSMGELIFFLGLQVMQKEDGIFISQDKYVDEILKKFGFSDMRIASTPIETSKPLIKDVEAEDIDVHLYRSMIGSLMYLTSSRPDIMFVVCAYARFQVTPKASSFNDSEKKSFRYLKVEGEGSRQPTKPQHIPTTALPSHVEPILTVASSTHPKKTNKHRKTKRKANEISQSSGPTTLVADETVHEERGDSMERAATTATSLDAEQGSGNINKTQSTAIPNDPFPQGTGSGGSPRRQDTILGDRPAQTRFERLSKQSNDPPLSRVNTLGSGEGWKVLDLEEAKTAQAKEIASLKKRFKKLEKRRKSRNFQGSKVKKLKQGKAKWLSLKEEKLARQREEDANIAEWDDVQAMIDADYELTIKLQAIEQGELSIEEKSRLFVELMNKRKKHFARLREEEQRRKPPTKAQKRNTMSTYLKNMAGYKHNQLKTKSFEDIQMLFDKEMKRVITFVDMDTELVKCSETRTKGSSKRVGDELESDNSKKQKLDEHIEAKIDDDQEEAEMKKHMDIVQDDEVAIDAIPLATKPPIIVEWKIIKEGKMGYFQLIRADEGSKRYSSMIQVLQNIDREYFETLWNLVKAKHGNTRPEEGYERVLWGDLKVMFEPDIETEVWRDL
ncbi:putative ribonuclease H-like domain-containing protein [Tanacetum coccineum]